MLSAFDSFSIRLVIICVTDVSDLSPSLFVVILARFYLVCICITLFYMIYIFSNFLESKHVLYLNMQQLMHQADFFLNGGLFSGTYSLQGPMRSIQRLLQLTLRFFHYVIFRFVS